MQAFTPSIDARGYIMPNFIYEHEELNHGAKLLFCTLCDYARKKSFCYPSKTTLAKRLHASLNSIKKWLRQLVSLGFVVIQYNEKKELFHLFSPKKTNSPNQNNQQENQSSSLSNNDSKESNSDSKVSKNDENISKNDTEDNVKNLNNLTHSSPPLPPDTVPHSQEITPQKTYGSVEHNQSFEDFWNIYPKKENKEKARIAFVNLAKEGKIPHLSLFEKAISHFVKSEQWQRENGRFIPQLYNFLKDLRWEELPKESPVNEIQPVVRICESTEEMALRAKQARLEREKIEAERKETEKAWEEFSKHFVHDSSFNRFTAKRYFFIHYQENPSLFAVEENFNITAFQYFSNKKYI